jgi:hypothetical protein
MEQGASDPPFKNPAKAITSFANSRNDGDSLMHEFPCFQGLSSWRFGCIVENEEMPNRGEKP